VGGGGGGVWGVGGGGGGGGGGGEGGVVLGGVGGVDADLLEGGWKTTCKPAHQVGMGRKAFGPISPRRRRSQKKGR